MVIKRKIIFTLFLFLFLCFCSISEAKKITIAWDTNDEPDLDGYNVYVIYKKSQDGHPLVIKDLELKDCPDPNTVTTDITIADEQIEKGVIIAVTAYDISDLESDYSEWIYWLKGEIIDECKAGTPVRLAKVSGKHFLEFAKRFGKTVASAPDNTEKNIRQKCDFDGDGTIGPIDFWNFCSNFNNRFDYFPPQ